MAIPRTGSVVVALIFLVRAFMRRNINTGNLKGEKFDKKGERQNAPNNSITISNLQSSTVR